jgi:hypothetical protein
MISPSSAGRGSLSTLKLLTASPAAIAPALGPVPGEATDRAAHFVASVEAAKFGLPQRPYVRDEYIINGIDHPGYSDRYDACMHNLTYFRGQGDASMQELAKRAVCEDKAKKDEAKKDEAKKDEAKPNSDTRDGYKTGTWSLPQSPSSKIGPPR